MEFDTKKKINRIIFLVSGDYFYPVVKLLWNVVYRDKNNLPWFHTKMWEHEFYFGFFQKHLRFSLPLYLSIPRSYAEHITIYCNTVLRKDTWVGVLSSPTTSDASPQWTRVLLTFSRGVFLYCCIFMLSVLIKTTKRKLQRPLRAEALEISLR